MQEFNKVTTTSNFIKQLLNTTYLPVVRTVLPGDFVIKDRTYIYHCSIITCTESGYLLPYEDATLTPVASFNTIGEYHFGERNGKLCTNFTSNSEGYDSKTHEGLGRYLRALRDMYGLNLMPLYNCFSNNTLPVHHIFDDRVIKTSYDYGTKIYKVPIRFNTDYTVCIENLNDTTIAPAFIRNNNLVRMGKNTAGETTDITNEYISVHTSDVISTYTSMRFFSPIVVRFNNIPEKIVKSGPDYTNEVGYDIQEINVKVEPGNEYFKPVSYSTAAELNKNIDFVYTLDTTTPGKLIKYTADMTFIKDGVYFECRINPKQMGWREKTIESLTDNITIEGDVYKITEDEYFNPTKQYYRVVSKLKSLETIYDVDEAHCNKYDFVEDTLYMLIQVPDDFENNIVVLEGDYTHTQSTKIFNNADLGKFPDSVLDHLFIRNLRLLRMNTKILTPFSDTLIQFLLWHVICNLDTINLDMDRLHSLLRYAYVEVDDINYANYWFYRYRQVVYDWVKDNNYEFIDDNLGYVTTEIEHLLEAAYNDYQS